MSTPSASRADPAPSRAAANPLIWDAPIRVFHWLMVLCFAGAFLTAESEAWRLVHVTLGYTLAGLVAFRLLWGFWGTRYARFSEFVRGPSAVIEYLRSIVRGRPDHYVGHNPAGAWAILAILVLALCVAAAGWAAYSDLGGDAFEEIHEVAANVMLVLVIAHVAAVIASSRLHRDNLVLAMITGRKSAARAQGIEHARRGLALLLVVSVLGFWAWQWHDRNTSVGRVDAAAAAPGGRDGGGDDD